MKTFYLRLQVTWKYHTEKSFKKKTFLAIQKFFSYLKVGKGFK